MKKQQREELNVLLQLPGCVFWKDSKGRFTGCNNSFAEFLRLTPEEIVGKTEEELSFTCVQGKAIDGEGHVHRVLSRSKPLHDDHGRVVGTISIFIEE
jgi:PAS domain-containing protein